MEKPEKILLFFKSGKFKSGKPEYKITSFVLLRVLGFVYFFAFLSLAMQVMPLIGSGGLMPADNFLNLVGHQYNSRVDAFIKLPTIFWFNSSDKFLLILAWSGVVLSLILLLGFANVPLMFLLWLIYMSFVHIGQIFYSYGWEILLLETGFLAIFLCPLIDLRPFYEPPRIVIWLFRWLAFRLFLGAGLIKIKADSCWRDLTCLYYHYETQPIPNPLSRFLHFMPKIFQKFSVLWNHLIELVVPFFVFYPATARYTAGILLISFQFILMATGNFSFLNWIAIVPCIACFDDDFFKKILPVPFLKMAGKSRRRLYKLQHWSSVALLMVVLWLSIPVVENLTSHNQIMNASFNRLDFVNTYGVFGAIGRQRFELIIEGTNDETINSQTRWKEYEFKYKPGNIYRQLPVIAPYQPRIDWQIWFAAMESPNENPWLIHMVWKLLHNDKGTLSLLSNSPFPDNPPSYVRIQFYKYEFTNPQDNSGAYWKRNLIGTWIPPVSKSTPELRQYIQAYGWNDYS